jgi:hypothetical protein
MPKVTIKLAHKPGTGLHLAGILRQYAAHSNSEHKWFLRRGTKAAERGQKLHQAYLNALDKAFLKHYSWMLLPEDRKDKNFTLSHYGTGDKDPFTEALEWFGQTNSAEG